MKAKMKTWTRVLFVCITMSLFCVNAHPENKRTDAERLKYDVMELNILTTDKPLK